MDAVERVARRICVQRGYEPDYLEPGDAFGIDGHRKNGDPAHFMWREFAEEAQTIVAEMRESTKAHQLVIAIDGQISAKGSLREAVCETTATGVRWTISGRLAQAVQLALNPPPSSVV